VCLSPEYLAIANRDVVNFLWWAEGHHYVEVRCDFLTSRVVANLRQPPKDEAAPT
jgi:hypothetical protein